MVGNSLNGDLERPFHEAVKVKPGLNWETHDVRDARTMKKSSRVSFKHEVEPAQEKTCATEVSEAEGQSHPST